MKPVLLLSVLVAIGCGSSDAGEPGESTDARALPDGPAPSSADAAQGSPDARPSDPSDRTIVAFDGEYVHFTGENRREVDVPVAFPAAGESFADITLSFALRCPNQRCDWWDRVGWLSIVEGAGTDNERQIEIHRFITPYRVGWSWDIDVTDLRPLLTGDVTLRVFIDTWVGPGHSNGDGWLVDASFVFRAGVPQRDAFAVVPVWPVHTVGVGDPAAPMDERAVIDLPEGVAGAQLRTLVTGHGQGNADNCAEFCAKDHTISIAGVDRTREIWRDDCAATGAPGQAGNWRPARAGWCPGAEVHAWYEDVGGAVAGRTSAEVTYAVEPYENTCRPDGPCTGCVFGVCEYNGGSHTPPVYHLSSLLVLYR